VDHSSATTPSYNLLERFLTPKLESGLDLPVMRECAEELRDRPMLLKNALQRLKSDPAALRAVASRSSVHPNGFAKVVLARGDDWSLRLHVWSPEIAVAGEDGDPHGHRWAFASWIIAGVLRETRFAVAREGRPFRHYEYLGSKAASRRTNREDGTVGLVQVEEIDRVAGTVYDRRGHEVHTAEPCTDLVATLVLHGESADSADVFKRPGKDGDDHERPLPVDHLELLIEAVLAAVP
jgi:hypothetical protein